MRRFLGYGFALSAGLATAACTSDGHSLGGDKQLQGSNGGQDGTGVSGSTSTGGGSSPVATSGSGGAGVAGSTSSGGGSGGTGANASSSGGNAAGGSDTVGGPCAITDIDGGCAWVSYGAESIPLDIYIMFDVSASMSADDNSNGLSRLDEVRMAIDAFVQDPASMGISVGIGYFGDLPSSSTSCNPADYADAEVPIGPLPGNTQAIVDSLASKTPTGETPTGAALRGGCTYAGNYKLANPSRDVVILLVTDGKPEAPSTCSTGTCCPTTEDAVAAAAECLGEPPGLKTYVLAVDSADQNLATNMQSIAVAGGTDAAYIVSATGDASTDVLNVLNQIRPFTQIPCDLQLPSAPSGTGLDYANVNLIRTSANCEQQVLDYASTLDQCDPNVGGWYFDNPTAPSRIHLCPKSCEDVSIPTEQLTLSLGCSTVEITP